MPTRMLFGLLFILLAKCSLPTSARDEGAITVTHNVPDRVAHAIAPSFQDNPNEMYLSLGPNIYGKIKTLFATYTYFSTGKSREVITQVSTSIFSTSQLPSSMQEMSENLLVTKPIGESSKYMYIQASKTIQVESRTQDITEPMYQTSTQVESSTQDITEPMYQTSIHKEVVTKTWAPSALRIQRELESQ